MSGAARRLLEVTSPRFTLIDADNGLRSEDSAADDGARR